MCISTNFNKTKIEDQKIKIYEKSLNNITLGSEKN